ncbi:MAG: hypothetical protein VX438_17295, partial [Planctomycetota bacterium]|nr:hypothetical protein [Planctomycetota bacterium]
MSYSARLNDGKWVVSRPDRSRESPVKLEVVFQRSGYSPVYEVPEIVLNDRVVKLPCKTLVAHSLQVLRFGEVLSSRLGANLAAVFWLPSLAMDTSTVNNVFPWNSMEPFASLEVNEEKTTVLIEKNVVTVFALVLFALTAWVSMRFRRKRTVLNFAIATLLSAFILGQALGLIVSFAFWGFACGTLLRELSRLCKFSSAERLTSLLVFCLCCLNGSGLVLAQDESLLKTAKSDSPEVIPAIIPVGTDDRPLGVAYLPEEFYEKISQGKQETQGAFCRRAELTVLAATDDSRIAASLLLKLTKIGSGKLVLPFFVSKGVFDANSVVVDGTPVVFQPKREARQIEMETDKSGEITVEIKFLIPMGDKPSVELLLPFPGSVNLTNRAGYGVAILRPKHRQPQLMLNPNESLDLTISGEFFMKPRPKGLDKVTVFELIDLNASLPVRTLKVFPSIPFKEDFVFKTVDGFPRGNQNGVGITTPFFFEEARGREYLEINLSTGRKKLGNELSTPTIVSTSHAIERYVVLLKSREGIALGRPIRLVEDEVKTREIERWNQYGTGNLTEESVRQVLAVDPYVSQNMFWVVNEPTIDCLATHNVLVSGRKILIQSEIEVSSEFGISDFFMELPGHYKNIRFQQGEMPLDWVRVNDTKVKVFLPVPQLGRFTVGFEASFGVQADRFTIGEPVFEATTYQSNNRIFANRQRLVKAENLIPAKSIAAIDGFVQVGSLQDLNQEIWTQSSKELENLTVSEEVTIEQGKIMHSLNVGLDSLPNGSWLGIEIPNGGIVLNASSFSEDVVIEDSEIFGQIQVWVAVSDNRNSTFELVIQNSLENNQVPLCRFVNVRKVNRMTQLPSSIGGSRLRWVLAGSKPDSQTDRATVLRSQLKGGAASYQAVKMPDKKSSVVFCENKYLNSERRLFSRFYVVPNKNNQIRIRVPGNQILETVAICGTPRKWIRDKNGTILVRLLNRRHLQVVDLTVFLNTDKQATINMQLPAVLDAAPCPRFLQCSKQLVPSGVLENRTDSLNQQRIDFVKTAIETFEVNQEGSTGWSNVLKGYLEMNSGFGLKGSEFAKRIEQVVGPSTEKSGVARLSELC